MSNSAKTSVQMRVVHEHWPLVKPVKITGYTFVAIDLLVVTLEGDGHIGRGEAAGVYYRGETIASMTQQIESLRHDVEAGLTRGDLQRRLAPGGARNALDCALWELEAKRAGRAVWELCELPQPRPIISTFTLGAESPDEMARGAKDFAQAARSIKLKLLGDGVDAARVQAVREARPDVWLSVDANQGFTRQSLEALLPALQAADVKLIEQPCRIGHEAELDGLRSPIPLAADESAQDLRDLSKLKGRFELISIKLDKCGGLTEGLAMAREARRLGFDVMVGNMGGTSLAMAPAFLVGQLCAVVDLDGPLIFSTDREQRVSYEGGSLRCPENVWGGTSRAARGG